MINKIEFVYFDVGGVAILDFSKNNKWQDMMEALGIPNELQEEFVELYGAFSEGIDAGMVTTRQVQDKLAAHFEFDWSVEYDMLQDFVDRFDQNIYIHPVIQKLKENLPVGLLTNMYPNMLELIQEADLLPPVEWDVIVDSSVEKVKKPQREIYELAEERSGFSGSSILFVDNLEENLETAKELGWQTFLYDPANPNVSSTALAKLLYD